MTTPKNIIDEESNLDTQENEAKAEKSEIDTTEENTLPEPSIKPVLKKSDSERELALLLELNDTEDQNDKDHKNDVEQKQGRLRNLFQTICGFFIDCAYFLKKCKGATASEFGTTIGIIMTGFFIFGFIAFAIKVIHIPFNQILTQD